MLRLENVRIIPLFWDFFFLPFLIQKQCFRKAKVQFYCTGATTDFCVDNQWCLGLKSQTNKNLFKIKKCKEEYSGRTVETAALSGRRVRYERGFNLILLGEIKKNKAWL